MATLRPLGCDMASSIARSTARAFAPDSANSYAGLRVGDGAAAGLDVRDAVLDDDRADVDARCRARRCRRGSRSRRRSRRA